MDIGTVSWRSVTAPIWVFAWLCLASFGPCQAAELEQLLQKGHVPGLSFAVIRDGKIAELGALGTRDSATGMPVDENTVFEAASLSKPVFAYAVLQLIDSGVLTLDTPLAKHVPDYVRNDPLAALVTVRDVLAQTSGLPNWSGWTTPLKVNFPPGSHFSYSGEGFLWLQRVVEATTGENLNAVMTRLVFDPLGMKRTSYVWRADFETDHAVPHQGAVPRAKSRPTTPVAAYTLHTTAADYASFLRAVLTGTRLKRSTAKQWLSPQVELFQRCIECLTSRATKVDQHVAWGLGWGLEPKQGAFFHWGDNGEFKAFATGSFAKRSAVVVLTNGSNGMAIMPEIIDHLLPGEHPAFAWLNYDRSTPSGGWLDWIRLRSD
ncbi:serine hydrolase domain-containing protein [Bosea sp. WAO]|uniref:serine hydrolase domain-containing protein n=1 Tax=Bosea sp. WAO TaxID=406341 RepID=UPI0008354D60|nr:serine hydrolase domain-containing protein [Bosea sp. WAO]